MSTKRCCVRPSVAVREMSNLCSHCGDSVSVCSRKEVADNLYHRVCYEKEIPRCQSAMRDFTDYYSTDKFGNVMFIGMHVHYLYGFLHASQNQKQDKRRKRELKLKHLVNKVSALRNSNSGSLLIQLVGLDPHDSYIGAFDEFADGPLNSLIEDGKLFSDVFKRERMNVCDTFSEYFDFIVLRVAASAFLTTSDFKAKVALDDSIVYPLPYNIFKFLKEKKKYPEVFPEIPDTQWAEELEDLEESRSVQMKSNFKGNKEAMSNEDVLKKIFDELKLKEYVSTFTKNDRGGVYLFGVGERSKDFKEYRSKQLDVHGVTPTNASLLKQQIVSKLKEEMLVCDFNGKQIYDSDIIKVDLVPFKDGACASSQTARRYVLRISVKYVQGIVFYDKDGPLAYRVTSPAGEESREAKLSLQEWFNLMSKYTGQ